MTISPARFGFSLPPQFGHTPPRFAGVIEGYQDDDEKNNDTVAKLSDNAARSTEEPPQKKSFIARHFPALYVKLVEISQHPILKMIPSGGVLHVPKKASGSSVIEPCEPWPRSGGNSEPVDPRLLPELEEPPSQGKATSAMGPPKPWPRN
jgi:hypothetical protein